MSYDEKPKRSQREGSTKGEVMKIISILAVGGLIAFAVLSGLRSAGIDLLNFINPFEPLTVQVNSAPSVIRGIKPLGELTTYEAQFAKANIKVGLRWGLANVCNVGASHAVQGAVRSAIDLSKITEQDITYDEAAKRLTIRLPQAHISDCSLDPVSMVQYESGGATFACPMDYDELRRVASYIALNEFRDDAIEGGLLERSQDQAELLLENFLDTLVNTAANAEEEIIVDVVFKQGGPVVIAKSCQPEPPAGWSYNADENLWAKQE